jgi:hypothetical protein
LNEIKAVLLNNDKEVLEYKRQLILKLAGTVLPRLNEHTGEGGDPINITFDKSFNATSRQTKTSS